MELATGAKGLNERIIRAFTRFDARRREARASRPDDGRFTIDEQARLRVEREEAAERENTRELEELSRDVEAEARKLRMEARKKLSPMLLSGSSMNREEGRWQDERAWRFLQVCGPDVEAIRAEVEAGIADELTDYSTALMDWAQKVYGKKFNAIERAAIDKMLTAHEARTGAAEFLFSARTIDSRLKVLASGNPWVTRNVTEQVLVYRADPELAAVLKASTVRTP